MTRLHQVLGIALAMLTGVMVSVTPAASAEGFSALALGYGGVYGWANGYPDMESARTAARQQCRIDGGGSCTETVAEGDHWYFAGVYCDGEPYTGASGVAPGNAIGIAMGKGFLDLRNECLTLDGKFSITLNQVMNENPKFGNVAPPGGLVISY